MRFVRLPLEGAFLIESEPQTDARGFFGRLFSVDEFEDQGLVTRFVQISESLNTQVGTLRGMHYQAAPHAETKVIRCVHGSVYDVIVDLRSGSSTFLRSFGVELTARDPAVLYVPKGFAHGFVTLEPNVTLLYLMDEPYDPAAQRGVRWNDPALGIEWPIVPTVMSDRDRAYPDID